VSERLDELRPEERKILLVLRGIPASPLRDRLLALLGELADFVAAPCCAELPADGAPCTSAQAACDQCRKLLELLEGLRGRLPAG
jgi:hypothetical protein